MNPSVEVDPAAIERAVKKAVMDAAKPTVERVIDFTVSEVQRQVHTSFRKPKSGRQYGSHRASAPGESPASRSGNLERSLNVQKKSWHETMISFDAAYAGFLEETRPFASPAAELAARAARAEFGGTGAFAEFR